jgi:hypothetical protein
MEPFKRTWEDFAEDLVSDGKSLNHILMVARNTRYAGFLDEIRRCVKKFRKFYRKKS